MENEIKEFIPLSEFVELTDNIETIRKYAKLCKTNININHFIGDDVLFEHYCSNINEITVFKNTAPLRFSKDTGYITLPSKHVINLLYSFNVLEALHFIYKKRIEFAKPLNEILEKI